MQFAFIIEMLSCKACRIRKYRDKLFRLSPTTYNKPRLTRDVKRLQLSALPRSFKWNLKKYMQKLDIALQEIMHTVLKFMENYHDSYLQSQRSCSTEFLRIPIVCFLMIKHMRYWLFSTFPHANRICQLHEIFRLKFSECLGKINLVSIKFNYFVKCSVLNVDVRNYPATLLLFIP